MQSVDSWAAIWPPLTLAILAAIARRHGEVDLYDCNVETRCDLDSVVERMRSFAPDVVVVNTSFPSIEADNACAAAIKAARPNALIVGFGVFFTLLEREAMRAAPGFDVAIVGEPEVTFAELLDCVAGGSSLAGLAGLLSRDGDEIIQGPQRAALASLDELPFAARDLLHNECYVLPHNGRRFTLVNVARGCPYKCSFCIAPAYYGNKLRKHSLEYVINELQECQTRYDIREFLFWEEVFTLDKRFGLELCAAIRARGWKISWATTTRADLLDREMALAMKQSGCSLLALGIETAHQHILDAANKHAKVEQMRAAVATCREVGLKTIGHFIFGLPGETAETAAETMQFARGLGLDYMQCYCAVPYPKTPLGEQARASGWITADNWSAYDFGGASIMNIGSISPAEVDRARSDMFHSFYFRPSFFVRQIGTLALHPRRLLQARQFVNWMRTE